MEGPQGNGCPASAQSRSLGGFPFLLWPADVLRRRGEPQNLVRRSGLQDTVTNVHTSHTRDGARGSLFGLVQTEKWPPVPHSACHLK